MKFALILLALVALFLNAALSLESKAEVGAESQVQAESAESDGLQSEVETSDLLQVEAEDEDEDESALLEVEAEDEDEDESAFLEVEGEDEDDDEDGFLETEAEDESALLEMTEAEVESALLETEASDEVESEEESALLETGSNSFLSRRRRRRRRRAPRAIISLQPRGWFERQYYFGQGGRVPFLAKRKPNAKKFISRLYYRNTGRRWPGWRRGDHMAGMWTARFWAPVSRVYCFQTISDDGSKVWIDGKQTVNNDGLHGWRARHSCRTLKKGMHNIKITWFERGGHAGLLFRYNGGAGWQIPRKSSFGFWRSLGGGKKGGKPVKGGPAAEALQEVAELAEKEIKKLGLPTPSRVTCSGWVEKQFDLKGRPRRLGNFDAMEAKTIRWIPALYYPNRGTKTWPGFSRGDRFGAEWQAIMDFGAGGLYNFIIGSDDGSKLFIDGKQVINNDGLHGFRWRRGRRKISAGLHQVKVTFFENGGHAGMIFRMNGPGTNNKWVVPRGNRLNGAIAKFAINEMTGGKKSLPSASE